MLAGIACLGRASNCKSAVTSEVQSKLIEHVNGPMSIVSHVVVHFTGVGSTFIVQLPVQHALDEDDDSSAVATRGHSVSFGAEVGQSWHHDADMFQHVQAPALACLVTSDI